MLADLYEAAIARLLADATCSTLTIGYGVL